jgi:hypothetical protein
MANTFTEVIPKLLAQGLLALRQQAVLPRLVNRAYDTMAGEKGSTIDVPIPSAVAVGDVAPANTPPTTGDSAPTKAAIALDKWKEAAFYLTDKDMLEVMNGTIPMQASEAIKAIANQVDNDLFALYKVVFGFSGVAGTTPFSADLSAYLDARKEAARQLAPMDPRFVVIDPAAEANALSLRAFQDASFRGDTQGIINGQIGNKLGALWVMDQLVPTHTAGTAAGATTNSAGYAIGVKVVTLASAGTGTILIGDIFTFAGDAQTYVVITGDASVADGGTVAFEPALKVTIPASPVAITLKASHVTNLLFHRDAFALAMRPFSGADPLGLGTYQSAIDPVSGLVLRLEVTREHKRTRFSYDVLYGVKAVRPELAVRIAG